MNVKQLVKWLGLIMWGKQTQMRLKVSIIVERDTQSDQPIWGKECIIDDTPRWSPNTTVYIF